MALEQVAQRVTDCRRLEQAARQLVEERLEGVVVVAVDEHDLRVRMLELLRGADAGEASAEHEDAWRSGRHQPTTRISYRAILPSRIVRSIRRSRAYASSRVPFTR